MAKEQDVNFTLTAVNRTKKAFDEIRRDMGEVEGASKTLHNTLAGLGTGLSIAGLGAFVKSGVNVADDLNKLSQKVGVSVESLSVFQFGAKLANVSAEELSVGLRQLAKNAQDAQRGTGDAADAFEALRIQVSGAGGQLKGTEELLLDVAERFSKIEDGAGKTALAMKIFGRSGAELIPFLNQGRQGFEGLRKEAERLGLVISTETARAAEKFNDDITRIVSTIDRLKLSIAESALPILQRYVEQLLEGQKIAGGFGEALRLFGLSTITSANAGQKVKELREELEELQVLLDKPPAGVGSEMKRRIESQISDLNKLIEHAKFLQRQAALEMAAGTDFGREGRRSATGLVRENAPSLPDPEFKNRIKQLELEAIKIQEISELEKVSAEIKAGRFGQLNAAQVKRLKDLAAVQDQIRSVKREEQELQQGLQQNAVERSAQSNADVERLARLKAAYMDLIDPLEKYRKQLREVHELLATGFITPEQALEMARAIDKQIDHLQGMKEEIKETTNLWKEMGFTAASAFEDAIVAMEDLRSILQGLLKDLLRITIRQTVTNPLGEILGGLFKDIFGGGTGGLSDEDWGFDRRAGGGPVTAGRPYMVGESGEELFVPGRSGTIIPNHALGGFNQVLNINFSANTPAAVRDAVYSMLPTIQEAAKIAVFDAQLRGLRV